MSEETEVKKDIRWLRKKVLELQNNGNAEANQTEAEREIGRLQKWAWDNCLDRVHDLIDQLDEPETLTGKVQLSQKMADDLNRYKERGYSLQGFLVNADSKQAQEKLARAWLDGFTVNKEPLYRARLSVITNESIAAYLRTQSSDPVERLKALEIGSKYIHEDYRHLSEFTEEELKGLNVWDSEQWEIEEVEE